MFDNSMFEDWLDKKAFDVFQKVGRNESIRSDEMMILVLKAQANHFIHLDADLRKDMRDLREDMNERFVALREDMNKRVDDLRDDMNRRFTSMQWLIGLGIGFLTVLMSLYQFLQ